MRTKIFQWISQHTNLGFAYHLRVIYETAMVYVRVFLWTCGVLVLIGIALTTAQSVQAQTPQTESTLRPSLASLYTITATTVVTPEVRLVSGTLQLKKPVMVQIDKLSDYINKTNKNPQMLIPFLNGKPLNGIHPMLVDMNLNQASFYLDRTSLNKEVWDDILRNPFSSDSNTPWRTEHKVIFSVGFENEQAFPITDKNQLYLVVIDFFRGSLALIGFIIILGLFIWLCVKSNILRNPPANVALQSFDSAYSLGLTQMAWWFFIVLASYSFIGIITWDLNTITGSTLVLLGISASTAIGANVINNNKLSNSSSDIQQLLGQRNGLIEERRNLLRQNNSPTRREMLNSNTRKMKQIDKTLRITNNFLWDILSDSQGISFHRFQIIIWTVVLGVTFISSVITNLTMPEFNGTLLALIGISSGTYIGFKFSEPDPEKVVESQRQS